MKCEDCRFWEEKKKVEPGNGVRMGHCRRNPPIATGCFVPKANPIANTITPQLVEMTLWPQVSANNWCGEYRPENWPKVNKHDSCPNFEAKEDDRNRKTQKEAQES